MRQEKVNETKQHTRERERENDSNRSRNAGKIMKKVICCEEGERRDIGVQQKKRRGSVTDRLEERNITYKNKFVSESSQSCSSLQVSEDGDPGRSRTLLSTSLEQLLHEA